MPDFSDIPDEAVTASSEAVYGHRLNYDDHDVDGRVACLCEQWREPDDMVGDEYSWGHHVARAVLAAALPIVLASRATCDEPMPVEGNAEEVQTCDYPAIPGTDRCPVHDPRHVEYLADLVAEIRQKDLELEEWRTGVLRLPLDAAKADDDRPVCPCVTNDDYVHPSLRAEQ